MRAVRSLLRDVRSVLDSFADALRTVVRAFAAFLERLVLAVYDALQRLFGWMREVALACMRLLRRTVRRFSDDVRSFLTAAQRISARSSSNVVRISSRSIRHRQTSRSWFSWLFPLAGQCSRLSRHDEEEEERWWMAAHGKVSVHAVHGDRFSRRKKHVAGIYVGRVANDQLKIQKVPLREADDPNVLQRMQQIGWQTRTRTRRLS